MKISDIINPSPLAVQQPQPTDDQTGAYADSDTKRFQQIADLEPTQTKTYSTTPNEQYADIDAVTDNAGADSWQGTKHPDDLRGNSFRIYGGN